MLDNTEKRIILCVDDEKIILDSLESELSSKLPKNYIIELAESGEEALEIIEETIEDGLDLALIISDYIMPNMKGDEVLIKAHKLMPDTIKIMLTGQADANAVGNVINKAKLYQYISKPWEKDDLWLTINSALESYEQHKNILAILNEKKDAQKKIIATRKQMFEVHSNKLKEQQMSVENLQITLERCSEEKNILIDKYQKLDISNQKMKNQNNLYQTKLKDYQNQCNFKTILNREIQRSIDFQNDCTIFCCGVDTFDILINKWEDKATETRLLTLFEQYLKELIPSYNKIEKLTGGRFKILMPQLTKERAKEKVNQLIKDLQTKIGRFGDDLITISFASISFNHKNYFDKITDTIAIAESMDKDIENTFSDLRLSGNRNSISIQ
jgi:CheY-like chemotaxis protein/GGDEF domain-containing protein